MNKTDHWFEVDKEGLKSLQLGKPKHYVLRELVQNAWDENITECIVTTSFSPSRELATITVKDNNPEGFLDLRDSFTLFKDTRKRRDPSKRGRFNLGEKQAIAIAEFAVIQTTKGKVIFDDRGKIISDEKLKSGSEVSIILKMTDYEYTEMILIAEKYLRPKNIKHIMNGKEIKYKEPMKIIEYILPTQFETNGELRDTERKTKINILKENESYLYELGIPVMNIDCPFSIDIQQKIPLSVDRESVSPRYLKKIFAIVLNETIDEIDSEDSSSTWINIGSTDKGLKTETMEKIIRKRFGEKVASFNPFDPVANDDALAEGFKLIQGRELSKEIWSKIRDNNLIQSTTALFGKGYADDVVLIDPDDNMKRVEKLSKKIAKKFLHKDIRVEFYTSIKSSAGASYGNSTLSFNVTKLGKYFFIDPISVPVINLVIHELGHDAGMHTEKSYHELITKLAGELILTALNDPSFFKI